MNFILFDDPNTGKFYPLTFTKPVCELRTGILNIREKWEHYLSASISWLTVPHLQKKFPCKKDDQNILINGRALPNASLVDQVNKLKHGQALILKDMIIAVNLDRNAVDEFTGSNKSLKQEAVEYKGDLETLENIWELFSNNHKAINDDFSILTKGRTSSGLNDTNRVVAVENIFVEEGAKISMAILNAEEGPIYIGKKAVLMEDCIIHGPASIGDHATVKFGAKIYDGTTIGPHCKAAGEILNSVMSGYSNKSHEGFLGNSVIGEWCNIGADSNNSNLKNNYSNVKMWNYDSESFKDTGLQFCGMIMGDHSKCGINTMFNTGTMVGVSANIYGAGFPNNYIPSFAWGGAKGFTTYKLENALETVQKVFDRRGKKLDDIETDLLKSVFEMTAKFRRWEGKA